MTRVLKAGGDVLDLAVSAAQAEASLAQEELLRAAFEAGRSQGIIEARATAENDFADAGRRAAGALERLTSGAGTADGDRAQEDRDDLLRSALQIAEWVLREELSTNGYAMLKRLEAAMGSLLPDRDTSVLVSPRDVELVREWAKGMRVEVIADASLAAGDALVRTSHGGADVSVAAALQLASDVLGLPGQRVPA